MFSADTARFLIQLRRDLRHSIKSRSETPVPEALYHYTDATGLLGIVTSGTLWATQYAYLNDASEFKYAVGVMMSVVEEATEGAEPDSWRGRFRQVVFDDSSTSDYGLGWAGDDDEHFVVCFSEGGDELSQWRGYGKSIGGYSLGFPFVHLQAIEQRINGSQTGKTFNKWNPNIAVEFVPCWYDELDQRALIAKGFERAVRHCETTGSRVEDTSLVALLSAIVRSVSSSFKDPAFKDEREWRLVVRIHRPSFGSVTYGEHRERPPNDIRLDEIATTHFRKGEYSLVPYIIVPAVLDAALSLSSVIVGPTPLPENARAAAIQLLCPELKKPLTPNAEPGRRVVCTEVATSRIPFRRV